MLLFNSCIPIPAQIKFNNSIEIGYESRRLHFVTPSYSVLYSKSSPYTTINISTEYKKVNMYASIKTLFKPIQIPYFNPFQSIYTVGILYPINRFEFGVEHMCSHTIDKEWFNEDYNRISIKVNLFK